MSPNSASMHSWRNKDKIELHHTLRVRHTQHATISKMLRGQEEINESTTMSTLMVLALIIIAVLKTATFIIALSADKQKSILPVYADEGRSTSIQRSPSDSTIHKRYMVALLPPTPHSIRSPPPTPSSIRSPSFEAQEIKLQMPSLEVKETMQISK